MPHPFYGTSAWKTLRSKIRSKWKHFGLPCGLCGKPLDWSIKAGISVDHKVPRAVRPDLALEPNNLQCIHKRCHDSAKAISEYAEKSGVPEIGPDGWPTQS